MCSTNIPTSHGNNPLFNNLYNNLFLPCFSSSPGWLLVTRTRGAWWCRYRGHCRSGPRHLSPRSRVCAQEWHGKDIHSHIHSHPPMHTTKTKSKTLNSPNIMPSFLFPLPVQCGGGRRSGSSAPPLHDCPTSEVFSPRTVLAENICRCVQQIFQHRPASVPFLTNSTITFSCLASAAPQADSWWLGHVEPDDVVIADIAGQALDIFLHGAESAHKNGIVKPFTDTFIPIHPCTVLKKKERKKRRAKRSTDQKWCLRLLVLFLPTVVVGDGQEACHLLLMTAPLRMPSDLGQYWQKTFVDVFNKYSMLTPHTYMWNEAWCWQYS